MVRGLPQDSIEYMSVEYLVQIIFFKTEAYDTIS
jgi:hypothetical protein